LAGALRAFAALGLALTVATCRDALGPRSTVLGRVAVAPVFPSEAALGEFGLTIDAVRFIVVRRPADTIADTTLALPPDATELELDLRVPLIAAPETLSVSVVALSGTIPLFAGTSLVPVPSRLPPTVIPLTSYVGPAADSIVIQPRDPFILVNDELRFQVQGFNAGVPVTQFFVAWSTSDFSVAAINSFGVLRAPASRASVRVRARTPSGAGDSVTATFTLPATQLVLFAGGAQVDTVGDTLVTPLEVRALATDGIGVGGVSVRFRPLTGGGTVVDTLVVTDSAGRARTAAKLGGAIGIQTFEASVAGLSGTVTFSATALAGPVAQVLAAAGDGQLAAVNTAVATPPRVQVRDGGGNPVGGVTVTFAVTSSGGGVTGGTDTTDASGFATVGSWTLDTLAGTNTLRATVAGLSRTFTATGVAGTAAQLVATAGDLQSAVVGNAVATDPAVRAEDQFGNPVAGRSITFAVSGGGGSVSGGSQLTNAAGVATVGAWTLDTLAGTNMLTATTGSLFAGFTATGVPDAPSRLVKVLGDSQTAVVNTAVPFTPTVRLSDRYGNPIAGDTVDFAIVTDGGFVASPTSISDTGGLASAGAWTLANFVTQNLLQAVARGAAAVSPVQFTAHGTPDAPSQLLRETVDTQTAIAGEAVSVPPAVRVRDQFFNPVPGVAVAFTLTGTLLGSVTPLSAVTDSTGLAQVTTWTLDAIAGLNTLEADVPGLTGSPIVFSATGVTTAATTIQIEPSGGGDAQQGVVGTVLPNVYSVLVTDGVNPVATVPVSWAVTSGGGTITPQSTTEATGIASATRTLGPVAGPQTATASVGGLAGSPVTFTATALPDAPVQLVKQSADPQTATVATSVAVPPAVMVADQFGNGVAGVIVGFAATTGGGTIGAPADTTDTLGLATVGSWTLGSVAGANTLTVTAGALPAVTFTATGFAGPPARLAFVTEPGRSLAGDTIEPAVQVAIQDQFGNTVLPANDIVSLGLGLKPNPAAKLVGTVGVAAFNGVAVFADLAIDSAGIGYTLVATTPKLAGGAETKPFDVGGVIAAFTGDRLQPVAAAFNPVNGFVYVPGVENTLGVLDPGKGLLDVLPILQSQPFGVAVNATTNRVYVTTFVLLAGAVVVIDPRDNALIAMIPVEGEPRGIAIDEATDRIFVAVEGDPGKSTPPTLAVIDGKDNRVVIGIPFKDGALTGVGVAFNPNDRLVYVAIPNLGVGIFDPEAGVHVTTVPIVSDKGAAGTYGVAVDVRSNLIYATNRTEGTVSVVDPTKLEEINRLPVGLQPEGLGVDADRGAVYVGNSGDGTVSFIDASKLSVFATLIVGPTPKAAAVDPVTGRVYVPTFGDDRVRMIQP
jgi:adhesin/invasin